METLKAKGNWGVHTTIEKYNSREDFDRKSPSEIVEIDGNLLLNEGINLLWDLVAGNGGTPFSNTNVHIGVGNNGGGDTNAPAPEDGGLLIRPDNASAKWMYMGMDDTYPQAGTNQKIVFKSTFLPGVACFDWYAWTVANGNGNPTSSNTDGWPDADEVRTSSTAEEPAPDPIPAEGTAYDYGTGQANVVNLNHKQENMGAKFSTATWVISVEITLS